MAEQVKYLDFKGDWEALYVRRYNRHIDELKWLYMELYSNEVMFSELCYQMHHFFTEREEDLKNIDAVRENHQDWYRKKSMIGMRIDIENFSENINGLRKNIEHLEKSHVNFIHLLPFFEVSGRTDEDIYDVIDFRSVKKSLGSMEDFRKFTQICREKDIHVAVEFVVDHTSAEHEWAKKAAQGDSEYRGRYCLTEFADDSGFSRNSLKETGKDGSCNRRDDCTRFGGDSANDISGERRMDGGWRLNYKNPRVFNEMLCHFLYLANTGADVVQLDFAEAVMVSEGGAQEMTLQESGAKVHSILRMFRLISEVVCPGVLLMMDLERDWEEITACFGRLDKPECHLLYDKQVMPTMWNAVAMRDVKLLKKEIDRVGSLPPEVLFVNELRNEHQIKWQLDYAFLEQDHINEEKHREYLGNYFKGCEGYSNSRGELYRDRSGRITGFCGTTASMCGLEKAVYENDEAGIEKAIRLEVMLYACLFMRLGIPVIYSGDEIGQLNDYSRKEGANEENADTRTLQRGKFDWKKATKVVDEYSIEGRILRELNKIENVRKSEMVFGQICGIYTESVGDDSVLCMIREFQREKIIGIFNFSENDKTIHVDDDAGMVYEDLTTATTLGIKNLKIEGYGYYYLKLLS